MRWNSQERRWRRDDLVTNPDHLVRTVGWEVDDQFGDQDSSGTTQISAWSHERASCHRSGSEEGLVEPKKTVSVVHVPAVIISLYFLRSSTQ